MTHDKRTGPTTIASALHLVPASISTMTEEQWAEHDARIQAQARRDCDLAEATRASARTQSLLEVGFPRRALDESLRADERRSAIARLGSWDPTSRNVLVVSGDKGCGKTVAATWWARRQRCTPRFVRSSTFAASSRYDREKRDAWLAAPALVLDDLGTEYLDDRGSFLVDLDELIDVFYGDRRPLIVTTNLKIDKFRSRYGARIEDRLRESAAFFAATGGSMRGPS